MTSRRPKVAVVGRYYNKQGGVSNVMAQTAERIASAGRFDVHVFSHEFLDAEPTSGIVMHQVPMTRSPLLEVPTFSLSARRRVAAGDFDLVHVHDPQMTGGDIYTAHSCFEDYIRGQREVSGTLKSLASRVYPRHATVLRRERATYSATDATIVAVSRSVADAINDIHAPRRPAVHIYNGIDVARFSGVPRETALAWLVAKAGRDAAQGFRLAFVGYEFDRKRLAVAIDVVARLGPGVRLIVAGGGPVERFEQLAADRNVRDRVHFLGHVTAPEMVLRASDAFIFPTKYEAASLAILEALAAEIPVITTDVAMAHEVLTDQVDGLLLPNTDDAEAAADAAAQLVADPASGRRMARAGHRLAERFSWDRIASEYEDLYRQVLSRRGW